MSFSAMGFYPMNPSDGKYQLGTPMFKKVTIKLGQDRKFVIKANRENDQYIRERSVTEWRETRSHLDHSRRDHEWWRIGIRVNTRDSPKKLKEKTEARK